MTQFNASIVLDAEKATSQAQAFGSAITKTSKTLQKFQELTRKTTQGGGSNVFRAYENSISKLDVKMRSAVAGLHSMKKGMTDTEREFSKLTEKSGKLTKSEIKRAETLTKTIDLQKKALPLMVSLNKKYDENARAVSKLKKVRNELNLVVASGLKTKREAVAIFKKEAQAIRETTTAFKKAKVEREKSEALARKEIANIDRLTAKYDKQYAMKKKLALVEKELTFLVKKGVITQEKKILLYKKEEIALHKVDKAAKKVSSTQRRLQKAATAVSIATRLMLGAYIALSSVKAYINLAKTADAVVLLDQKLKFFSGDQGSLSKVFRMTQEVGIGFKDAGRIITRFAVVTKGAFSIDTMNEWTATLTKSARATGTSTQEMTGALIQITQAMSAGRLMGDEYRSVTENLPLLTVALRDMFRGTSISLKEMSSRGLLTTDVLIEAFGRLKDIVADIPGTTNTVEARLAALGAAWDKFVSKVIDTDVVKGVLDMIASTLNFASSFMDESANKAVSSSERLGDARARILRINKEILSLEGKTKRGTQGAINKTKIAVLNVDLKEAQLQVNSLQSSIDRLGDTDLERVKKSESKKEQVESLARESKSFGGGFDKQDLIDSSKLEKQSLQFSNDARVKRKEAAHSESEMKRIFAVIDKRTQEEILKGERKFVDERLKLQGFKTKTNFDFVQNESASKKSVVAINKRFNKQMEDIASARAKFDIEKKSGIASVDNSEINKNLSLSEAKAAEYEKIATRIRDQELSKEMDKVNEAMAKLTTNDVAKSLSPYQAHLSAIGKLETKRKENLLEYAKLRREGSGVTGAFNETEKEGIQKVNDVTNALVKLQEERFSRKFASQFSARIQAQTEYKDALESLEAAKKGGLLTTYEIIQAENDLANAFQRSTNLANARSGALSQNDQVVEGMQNGLKNYAENAKTTFEIVSEGMEGMANSMADSLTDFVMTGKGSFKDMANAMIQDLIRIFVQAQITFAMKSAVDSMSSSSGGSSGWGLFESAVGMFASSGTSGGTSGGTSVMTSSLGGTGTSGWADTASMFGGMRAAGGPVSDNEYYVVGEKGPEVFIPNSSGKIIPNNQLGGGQQMSVVNNITVSAPDGRLSKESMSQLQQKMAVGMDRSMRRNS